MDQRRIVGLGAAIALFGIALQIPEYARGGISILPVSIVTLSWPIAGVLAWLHRPDNPTGRLLLIIGALWTLPDLAFFRTPLLWTTANLLAFVWMVPFLYLLLTFPGSRLPTRRARFLVASAAVLAFVDRFLWTLKPPPHMKAVGCDYCADLKLIQIAGLEDLVTPLYWGLVAAVLLLIVVAAIEIRRRWRETTWAARRGFSVVVTAGFVALVTLETLYVVIPLREMPVEEAKALIRLGYGAFAIVPFGFLMGLVRAHARRARIGELVVELGEQPLPEELQDALRRKLGDPGLVAAVWVPEAARYLTPEGRPLVLPEEGANEVATFLDRHGEPLAVIVHDRSLLDDPHLVESMKAATGLAVENERLHQEVLTQLMEVEASRARIVRATDEERRRIERNLHDGAQQRLVSLVLSLRLLKSQLEGANDPAVEESIARMEAQLAEALRELRELAHGVHPAILREAGIRAALESIAEKAALPVHVSEVPPDRFPEVIEATVYFIVAEACSNIAKYAHASQARVAVMESGNKLVVVVVDDGVGGAEVRPGGGLSGLADRVEALGGTFAIETSTDGGTTIRAEVPTSIEVLGAAPARTVPILVKGPVERPSAASKRPLLACRNIGYSYEGNAALTDVDLDVHEGDRVAVVGTNGAGKSTLLRIVAGLSEPDSGTIHLEGREITFVPAEGRSRSGIVYVPGGHGVFTGMSVIDNLRIFATGSAKAEVPDRIDQVFERFPVLAERGHSPASQLSRGQQQMLALAKALMKDVRLLIVDELCMGLAPPMAEELIASMEGLSDAGIALLFVEQSSEKALRLARRAYFLHAGRVEYAGSARELSGRTDIMRAVFLDRLSDSLAHA